jgi:hypothetical protein
MHYIDSIQQLIMQNVIELMFENDHDEVNTWIGSKDVFEERWDELLRLEASNCKVLRCAKIESLLREWLFLRKDCLPSPHRVGFRVITWDGSRRTGARNEFGKRRQAQ